MESKCYAVLALHIVYFEHPKIRQLSRIIIFQTFQDFLGAKESSQKIQDFPGDVESLCVQQYCLVAHYHAWY